jgi:hypothetical protein
VSLATGDASPKGTHSFATAFDYYELQLIYQSQKMSRLTVELLSASTLSSSGVLQSIPSSNLISALPVGGPWRVNSQPSPTDLDVCNVFGTHLTVSTAGEASSFVIVARDTFGNLRGQGGDEFLVQASDGRVSIFGEVTDHGTGTYSVRYHPQVAGSYQVKVYMGTDVKHFTMFVHPGEPSPLRFTLHGASLTIATAGYTATFTVQAKDAFSNLRCLGTDFFNVEIHGPFAAMR